MTELFDIFKPEVTGACVALCWLLFKLIEVGGKAKTLAVIGCCAIVAASFYLFFGYEGPDAVVSALASAAAYEWLLKKWIKKFT